MLAFTHVGMYTCCEGGVEGKARFDGNEVLKARGVVKARGVHYRCKGRLGSMPCISRSCRTKLAVLLLLLLLPGEAASTCAPWLPHHLGDRPADQGPGAARNAAAVTSLMRGVRA